MDLAQILRTWNLSEIYNLFHEANIGVDELHLLKECDLKELFPSLSMLGVKVKLREKLSEWKKEKGFQDSALDRSDDILNVLYEIKDAVTLTENKENSSTSEYNIQNFLQKYCTLSKDLYISKQNPETLTVRGRTLLIKDAVEFFLNNGKLMQHSDFESVTDHICTIFKGENRENYYCQKGKYQSGRLYYTYKNSLSSLRKKGLIPSKRKKENHPESERCKLSINRTDPNKTWLQLYNTPFDEVYCRWRESFELRKQEIASLEFRTVLTEWPAYQMPFGKTLVRLLIKIFILCNEIIRHNGSYTFAFYKVDIDYKLLGHENPFGLLKEWETFFNIFNRKAEHLIKDKTNLSLLADLDNIPCEELRIVLIFDLLSAALTPTYVARNKTTKQIWKASIGDSQEQFILKVDTIENLEVELQRLSLKLKEHNCTLQPLVAFIKNEKCENFQIIGIYDSIRYEYHTVLEAVTNIFKLHFVLNLQYQKFSSLLWAFLQYYFFKIPSGVKSPKVTDLISELSCS